MVCTFSAALDFIIIRKDNVFVSIAQGYGRSEGAVCFYLQRAQDVKRNYGTLLMAECYYFGSNPYTYLGYDETDIENTLRRMYDEHKDINLDDVCYMEMDACGITVNRNFPKQKIIMVSMYLILHIFSFLLRNWKKSKPTL